MARVGDSDAQVREHLHAPRPDQVAARLVSREGRLVGQCYPRPTAGEDQGGHAARWARADHNSVKRGTARTGAHRASTIASATALVA